MPLQNAQACPWSCAVRLGYRRRAQPESDHDGCPVRGDPSEDTWSLQEENEDDERNARIVIPPLLAKFSGSMNLILFHCTLYFIDREGKTLVPSRVTMSCYDLNRRGGGEDE